MKQIKNGYIALTSVLVIAAAVLAIGTSVALLSISEGQVSLADKKHEETLDFVESCAEVALLELNEDNNISSSIALPEGSCSVIINSQSGNDWDFSVSGVVGGFNKTVQVTTTRSAGVAINSWQQVN